jgi:uncharacterized protein (DUF1778 family)
MSRTEAEDRAIKKYEHEKIDRVLLRMPKGKKDIIQQHVQATGESVNSFINRAVNETIERDNNKTDTLA